MKVTTDILHIRPPSSRAAWSLSKSSLLETIRRPLSSCNQPSPRKSAQRTTEGAWRDPEDMSKTTSFQGVLPRLLSSKPHFAPPILGQILPSRIHLLNQKRFFLPAPALELLFTPDGDLHIPVTCRNTQAHDTVISCLRLQSSLP